MNLISAEDVKRLGLLTTPHLQLHTIVWLHQERYLHVSQQCHLPYNIKPFMNELLCDVTPLEVCDVLLGQPYLWEHHVAYESRPCTVIIYLGNNLYRILKSKGKIVATSMALGKGSSMQQKQVDKVVEEYRDIFSSPTGLPLHCQVNHLIDLIPGAPLPNGLIYHHSIMKNEEIKQKIQDLMKKGNI
eukprot:PITA_02021